MLEKRTFCPKQKVEVDPRHFRDEALLSDEGTTRTRFSFALKGPVDVAWIDAFYRMQWAGLDDVGYRISRDCREIFVELDGHHEPEDRGGTLAGGIGAFVELINRAVASEDANQAA